MLRNTKQAKTSTDTDEQRDGESGQGLAEYALILAFVAAVCIGALGALGTGIATSPGFTTLSSLL
jgi:pilus assembly protein Flp/PilA